MQHLKERLGEEFPHVEEALQRAITLVPAPARPMAEHIFSAGGKRLRPFLMVLTARLFGYTSADIYDLAVSMEMLHAATLLHDDVLDNASFRRGVPAAHTLFTTTSTILAGDAILSAANLLVASYDDIRLCRCFSEATMQTAAGEILEIEYLRRLDQDDQVYEAIVLGKTAWLLRASCVMGALRAGAHEKEVAAMATYGQELGMAFQMVDDALDFAPEELTGKPSGGDLCEGKLTPPIRLYRESLQDGAREVFDAAFTAGKISADEAARIGADICRRGFDTQTRQKAGEALQRAKRALDSLPGYTFGKVERNLLLEMADYVQKRQK